MYKLGIADDEPKILAGLCEYYPWEEMGFTIRAKAHNGQDLLDFMKKEPLDVILTDISMPVMSGIELAEALKGLNSSIVIVFLSGYADFQYAKQAIRNNVYDYILKPVKYQELIDTFDKIRVHLDMEHKHEPAQSGNYYQTMIERVNRYALENLSSVSLQAAADKACISSSYLSKIYKQYTGRNFSEFLLEAKMNSAGKMLRDSSLKVYQVAEKLGYDDPKNFTRAFRSYYGCSPREYKCEEGAP